MTAIKQPTLFPADPALRDERERVFDLFRTWGYLQANLDPLGMYLAPLPFPELDEQRGPNADEARRIYCGTIGVEFMHIPNRDERSWIAERMENVSAAPSPNRSRILDLLLRAELFEQSIQSRYLGTKRFSLEGVTALIPFLDQVMQNAIDSGAQQAVLAMSHRGRLNVMAHIVGTSIADIFSRFEDVDPRSVLGGGDVKYHIGATGDYTSPDGRKLHVHLVSNPSHLEAVDPVAMGRTRAKQVRRGEHGPDQVFTVTIHGDAAFAGQGVWAETLNYAEIPGYSVGGSIHVIANNLIGFTTEPVEENSSRFASSLARRNDIPIFHVNGEDPEAVVRVAQIALEYRYSFGRDIVVDLIGYRRHGHSEVDDPTITQPLVYQRIKEHPPLWQLYAKTIGEDAVARVKQVQDELAESQKQGAAATKQPRLASLPEYWSNYKGGCHKKEYEVETGVSADELNRVTQVIGSAPDGFHVHPKVKKLLEQRREMGTGKRPIDYGMAEALAFGTLLAAGTPVRLSGQDSRRGTFNQRHDVLIDTENGDEYIPLQHVAADQARFEVYNSTLSEAGVMGFEYGYSRDFPETLTLWEAQFGDFANGAQIIIDQFIAAGEGKWNLLSGLVLLLPHGYEGQGPEHSSARIERYLQLAARDNMQICQPSNAAQYFHLLRRQALRPWRKPLVCFTPKSMLRRPEAASPLDDFSTPRFQNILRDRQVQNASRILLCSGKIGHELAEERKRRKGTSTAIVFLEQMYPFPEAELQAELDRHGTARDLVWVQEEPANMGALWFVMPRLRRLARGRPVRSVKRSPSASPATGSAKAHEMEQKTLLSLAFT
ncbi:MAG TPA: 2-oxoglutarate dehydrogenase E1 component [Terriglobales bacterium]|nr:2-oxoglutarate dehydrogenase E1 component [Terriglobales bacterium]